MAKRKRLSPAVLTGGSGSNPGSETPSARPPIAHVAGEAADQAALTQVTRALTEAREEGRLIQKLPLESIETGHLLRDRVGFEEEEMTSLVTSLQARGQQVPVEVVALESGRFGLISGLRRVMALRRIGAGEVLAILRQPKTSKEAYLAMVEENEIRAGISFYERARLASEAAKLGLFDSARSAISALFGSASAPKRSKIGSFVRVHEALGAHLRFPAAIPERVGLALAAALEERPGFDKSLAKALDAADPASARDERVVLDQALKSSLSGALETKPSAKTLRRGLARDLAPGLRLEAKPGRLVLSGDRVTDGLCQELEAWLAARG